MYKRTDIELDNKPDWLTKISPTGKVPVLILETDTVLFESSVIADYLDEATPSSLYPEDIVKKAKCKSWMEFGNGILNDIADVIYNVKDQRVADLLLLEIRRKLQIVESTGYVGPYFSGNSFGFADIVYATVFRYFGVFEHISPIKPIETLTVTGDWWKLLQQRASVREAVPAHYNDLLIAFIRERNSYAASVLND